MSANFNNMRMGKEPMFRTRQELDTVVTALRERGITVSRLEINQAEMVALGNEGLSFTDGVADILTVGGNIQLRFAGAYLTHAHQDKTALAHEARGKTTTTMAALLK